ncbi:MAG: polysaccharide deacetylase family protein [Candidatus Eremiobacteraeota bacterium]|nr:polysaccharide deacetylase family protein [Candidatus Eremiobacteraeota bacterium]MCL5054637.1 polysaccharide deacetylase family protein [Bacillota bacterium]
MRHQGLEIKLTGDNPQTRYVLRFLFLGIGFPFRIVKEWQNPFFKILCGNRAVSQDEDYDLLIPDLEKQTSSMDAAYFEGLPLLYYKGKQPAPQTFCDGKKVMFPLLDICFDLLSRAEELKIQNAFNHDPRFEVYQSDLYDLGLLHTPILNQYITHLRRFIEERLANKQVSLKPYPLWKNDKKFAVALTHDVDRIRFASLKEAGHRISFVFNKHLSASQRINSLARSWFQFCEAAKRIGETDDPFWNFETWLNLEKEFGFRSTFFVISLTSQGTAYDPSYRLKDRIKFQNQVTPFSEVLSIFNREGWEIGLHGSIASFNDPMRMEAEKKHLESSCGISAAGIRQHHLMFNPPDTWNLHEKYGFQYDSTLGSNRRIGYRAGVGLPFRPFDAAKNKTVNLWELPLIIQDGVVMEEEPVGIERAVQRCIRVFETAKKCGALVVLLWHPNTAFDLAYPGWFIVYKTILEWLSTQDVFVGTAKEICQWWEKREKEILPGE